MKRCFVFVLLAVMILSGCGNRISVPQVGDFSLELPEGYAIADIADSNCKIVCTSDDLSVGGMEYTDLKHKDVYDKKTDNIMLYLQEEFHQTYNVEYIATHWGSKNKIVSVNLKKHTGDGREEMFTHIFYERNQVIYHMWLDADKVNSETIDRFQAITGVD